MIQNLTDISLLIILQACSSMSVGSEVSMGGKKPVRIQILQPGLEKTLSSVNFSPFVYLR